MIYIERIPAPSLRPFVRTLWYARVPGLTHRRERVLPSGRVQVILNLARDFLTDCPHDAPEQKIPPSLVVGGRSIYEIVATADLADLIGIVFEPGGFPPFAGDTADLFANRTFSLEGVWGQPARELRDRLREIASPSERLVCLEQWLVARFGEQLHCSSLHPSVSFTLQWVDQSSKLSMKEIARRSGWSERRISQLFQQQVGFSPKVWHRIRRFQRAVQCLQAGTEVRWGDLAVECGFYDQAHLAKEFRAFSGITLSAYSTDGRTPWANHVRAD